ncbi:MAG: TldD/PmbA family protein [Candidatus Bipolaricaulota bacterium]|nr:TldD/PmbA family protein [Candidatus Bipolaricaulota bacterium]MDW8031031.1 TldD/PmbA family protein [Candidatus Bipolaricaulota bacterium]
MSTQIRATDLLEKVAKQTDGAELYELHSVELPVRFRSGALESVKVVETAGRALRVIKDGRLGFSTTTDLSDDTNLVQNALESACFGDPAPFRFPAKQPAPSVRCFDPRAEQLDEQKLIALGEEIVEKIKAYDSTLDVEAWAFKELEEVTLCNTSGLELVSQRTLVGIGASATRAREGDILIVYDQDSSRQADKIDAAAVAQRIIERLRLAERVVPVETKTMPVIFHRGGVQVLLIPFLMGLDGRNVFLGVSPLREKLNQKVFDERFSLIDDGTIDFAPRSTPYDDEGTPTARKSLIEHGVVKGFLYDLKSAGLAKAQPTGNGFKSGFMGGGFRRPPGIAFTSGVIPPGEKSLDQIIKDLDEALIVEGVMGLGGGNPLAGEFSNTVSLGFLVRKGEIVGRVKNTMIAGNVYDLLKDKLIALSDCPEWVLGFVHTPAIALDGVSVASK